MPSICDTYAGTVGKYLKEKHGIDAARLNDIRKLEQYNDPTAHFRMIREEVKQAAKDGKTKLQFPTGETAMKIEGLGDNRKWGLLEYGKDNKWQMKGALTPDNIKVGQAVIDSQNMTNGTEWIITDVLGDGKFKAVPKSYWQEVQKQSRLANEVEKVNVAKNLEQVKESFDISGKVDTNNPIYKFYEKDMGKYLKNKYGATLITDSKGVTWWQVPIDKAKAKLPVEAFGLAPPAMIPSLLTEKNKTDVKKGIVGGIDIGNYATSTDHVKAVASIYNSIGKLKMLKEVQDHIDKKAPGSKITADMISKVSNKYGLEWEIILAAARQDTGLGTRGLGATNKNPGNVKKGESTKQWNNLPTDKYGHIIFNNWLDGLMAMGSVLASRK